MVRISKIIFDPKYSFFCNLSEIPFGSSKITIIILTVIETLSAAARHHTVKSIIVTGSDPRVFYFIPPTAPRRYRHRVINAFPVDDSPFGNRQRNLQ